MLGLLLLHVAIVLTVTAQQNLARFGWATQSSQYGSAGPKNAVNRPISNEWGFTRCTHTSPNQTQAWWMFNISYGIVFITNITIYYRENFARRMNGFKLYVSNSSTTPPSASDLCYEDPSDGPYPAIIQTISCKQLGQYLIYYDDVPAYGEGGSVIELCYVSINGCEKTYWGSTCTKSCRKTCIDQHCFPKSGFCVWGCNNKNCLNDTCDKETAICTYGCKERRTGLYCNKYNIATNALVSQNPIGTKSANFATDGDKSTCSKTKGTNVWFQVDMTEIRIVTEFHITGKVNTTTNGLVHKIYASNYSAKPEKGTVLYQGQFLPQKIETYAVFRYLTYIPAIKTASVELEMCDIGIVGFVSVRSELQGELYGTAIGGGIGAMIAVVLIMFAGFVIYKGNKKLTKDKYLDQSKSSRRSISDRNRENNHEHEYVNAAITSDTGARTVRLEATTEETELLPGRDTFEHRQIPIEHSVNKIHIKNLKEAIIEKQKDEGFEKEYQWHNNADLCNSSNTITAHTKSGIVVPYSAN